MAFVNASTPPKELFTISDIKQQGKKLTYVKHPLKFASGVQPTKRQLEDAKIAASIVTKLHMNAHHLQVEEIAGKPVAIESRKRGR
jgi:hypothetical protein